MANLALGHDLLDEIFGIGAICELVYRYEALPEPLRPRMPHKFMVQANVRTLQRLG